MRADVRRPRNPRQGEAGVMEGAEAGPVSTLPRHRKRNPQLTGPRANAAREPRDKGLKVMQYWRLPATECADKAAPRNHHSRKTLTTGYPETGKPRPHSRMTEASALEGQPRRGREYADMQVPKYPHIGKHPRVCGEDARLCASDGILRETPPRMRGRPRRGAAIIIASCFPAGKSDPGGPG